MGLLGGAAVLAHASVETRGGDRGRRDGLEVAEQGFGEVEDVPGIDLARGRDDQPLGAILLGQPADTVAAGDRLDAGRAAEHGARDGLIAIGRLEQIIVDQVVGGVEAFAKLGQDDELLALEFLLVEARRADEVGDEFEPQPDVGRQRARMEDGLVARGPRVERPADVLDRLGNAARVASARALEHHMLDEMREPALVVGFGARADRGVQPDRGRLRAVHRVDGDGDAIGEAGELSHSWPPPRARGA